MQSFGKKGEDLAAEYLQTKDYQILNRNFRYKKFEIDLICQQKDLLVFVEVKTRTSVQFGYPESFVSVNQKNSIINAAEEYVLEFKWLGDIRFDTSLLPSNN